MSCRPRASPGNKIRFTAPDYALRRAERASTWLTADRRGPPRCVSGPTCRDAAEDVEADELEVEAFKDLLLPDTSGVARFFERPSRDA
jgi:hypothetical protein